MDHPSGPPHGPLRDQGRPPPRSGLPSRLRSRARALVLGALAVLAALIVIGVLTDRSGKGSGTDPSAATSGPATPAAPPAAATGASEAAGRPPAAAPAEFAGSGHQVTKDFTAREGLALVAASCPACRQSFTVTVFDAGGQPEAVPVIAFGPYEGTRGAALRQGGHYLKVEADAAWTVRISYPRGADPAGLPRTYKGRGDRLEGPFAAGGTLRIEGAHTGQGNFIVHVLGADGSLLDLPFNAVGDHRATATTRLHGPGPYYVDVQARGEWTLRLSGV